MMVSWVKKYFVHKGNEFVFHILLDLRNEFNPSLQKGFKKVLAYVPLIAKEFSKKPFGQFIDKGSVSIIHIARGEIKGE